MTNETAEGAVRRIGKYEVIGSLGRGSMGVVYKAQDPEIGRVVAIKTLRKLLPGAGQSVDSAFERFRNEARSAGKLRHPNIITIFEINREGDQPYLVMDYLEGRTLDVVIDQSGGKLAPDVAMHYLSQVAQGLDYAHSQGVIHKDIKPANILVDANDRVFILDFGIAQIAESVAAQTEGGGGGGALGTPAYMSPEQILNERLDARSDLFSLAIVGFLALAGKRPFAGNNFTEVLSNILNGGILSLCSLEPSLPPSLELEFERALSRDRNQRFQSADDMVAAFCAALGISYEPGRSLLKPKVDNSQWEQVSSAASVRLPAAGATSGVAGFLVAPPVAPPPAKAERPKAAEQPLARAARLAQDATVADGSGFRGSSRRAGELFQRADDLGERQQARSGVSPIRLLTAAFGVVSLVLGSVLAYSLLSQSPPSVPPPEMVLEVPAVEGGSSPAEALPVDPASAPVAPPPPVSAESSDSAFEELDSPSVDIPPANKRPAEMTDRQLLGVLVDPRFPESLILDALEQARTRKVFGLVEAAVMPLQNDSYVVRIAAIKAVVATGDKRIVPRLLLLLDDHDPLVRGHAAKGLGALGDRRALPYLASKNLTEEIPEVQVAIKTAIEKLNGFPMK